jgi:hypothetical protein
MDKIYYEEVEISYRSKDGKDMKSLITFRYVQGQRDAMMMNALLLRNNKLKIDKIYDTKTILKAQDYGKSKIPVRGRF